MEGKTLGIVGLGRIGRHVARIAPGVRHGSSRLRPGPRPIARHHGSTHRRRPRGDVGADPQSSDVLSLHVPGHAGHAPPSRMARPSRA
ncbi:NAD(P)-dependent oxidoreductase [Pseudomonas aeruginosa]